MPYPELFWSRYTSLGSQTQTPKLSKVLISGVSFHHCSLLLSHETDVLSLFRMQNSQNFLGLCPWTPLGRACSAPQTTQLHNSFSPCYTCRKTGTPKKLLDMALISSKFQVKFWSRNWTRALEGWTSNVTQAGCNPTFCTWNKD